MPPRRPAAPKSESRAGLVVALVFFILTTIILGVVAYMGYDGQEKIRAEVAAAKKSAEDANKAGDASRAELMAYKIMTGVEPSGDDLGALKGNDAFVKKAADIKAAFSQIGLQWNPQDVAAPESAIALMKKLLQEKATAMDNMQKTLAELDKTKTDYTAKEGTAESGRKAAEKKQQEANDNAVAAQAAADAAKKFNIDQIDQLRAKDKDNQEKAANAAAEAAGTIKKQQEDLKGDQERLRKYQTTVDAQRQKVLLTDKIHGQIKKVDSVSGTAYINLGSAEFVRPGMSFSILMKYDASQYGAEDELPKKATLAITEVLGEHQSQASIKYDPNVNPITYPVEVGDSLYKPGWRPGTPTRWALVGHFDLNGLGRDETLLLKRQLEKQGIIVDAYLDLNTLKIVGELNHGIDYLLLGNRPTGETARVIGEDRKKLIEDAMNDMIAKAQAMGITVIQHRVFLPIFGIDLPRKQGLPYFPGGGVGGAPTGEAPKAEKPKDEGK